MSRAAENHFHLVLDTVTMFSSAFTGDWLCQTSTGWKVNDPGFCCLAFHFWLDFPFSPSRGSCI